jgi:beta-lactamase regulating signal transducer with metallopeptidase domain
MSPLFSIALLAALLDLAVKSAAVMLLAVVVAGLLGRASAAWRHMVWSLSVLGLLVLPMFSLALPAWRVSWLPDLGSRPVVAQQPLVQPISAIEAGAREPTLGEPSVVLAPVTAPLPADGDSVTASGPTSHGLASTATGVTWLAPIWLIGVGVALVPLLIGLWQLATLHARSSAVRQQGWLDLLAQLREQLRVRRRVQLRQSKSAIVPLTWGAWRPVLLVPAEAEQWPTARLRLVMLHELAHVRRWDWLTQMLAHVACAVYWFNPLVWYAARRMRIEREQACDDLVLASGAKASDYAQELLHLARSLSDPRLSVIVAVPMARPGALEDRVRGILDPRRSRAALTTAAVGLAALLVAATVAPLAMLRAAPPKPAEPAAAADKPAAEKPPENKPAEDKPVQRDPTPEEIEARKSGIRISVLNSTGDKGIPEFRVIAGIDGSSVSEEFVKRTGRPVINWQPHTCRIGKEGDYVWPLDKAYDEMALRIEADGYAPQVFWPILKAKGVQHIVFQLTEDKGVAGRVLTPDGKPAVGATVALGLAQKDITWEGGKIRGEGQPLPEKPGDRWRRPTLAKTDAEGRFRLPTEYEPAAILVVHGSGVRELAYDAWQRSPEITLQGWGSIAGQILWKDKAGAEQDVTFSVHRDDYGYPGMIASYGRTTSDKEGRFKFENVLPGLTQVSLPTKPAGTDNEVILNGMFQHAKVAAGEPTAVLLGGQGRKVTGKLVGLGTWDGVTYHFHPTAPHIGFPGDDAMWKAFGELQKSSAGPILFRDKQPVNKDGTFTIENMLPGNYQLFVSAPGARSYAASVQIKVDPEAPGEKPAAQDLGEIKVTRPAVPAGGGAAAAAPKPDAPKTTSERVEIKGKAVDDETGKPIEKMFVQGGKIDSTDPVKVSWGYFEHRSSSRSGSFTTSVEWHDGGWTSRVVADGYVPEPVYMRAPPADKREIEVLIRLKRGRTVKGVVLDHADKPLKEAAVFVIGPSGLNVAAGAAESSEAVAVKTDEEGRFEIPAGGAEFLAVSHAAFDAWAAEIPGTGDMTIRLPEPARVEIELNIDGADKECSIFYQLLTSYMPEFGNLRSSRSVAIANPGKLTLAGLPPGKYQLSRSVSNNLGEIGFGGMLDREFFEVKAGETKKINYVRDRGVRLRGKAVAPAGTKLLGIVISVRAVEATKSPFDDRPWTTTHASLVAAADGSYLTERIRPGKYNVEAAAYTPLTDEQRMRTGAIGPTFSAAVAVEVPESGELAVPDLVLK